MTQLAPSQPAQPLAPAAPALRWVVWAETVLIFLVFFVQAGNLAPEVNEAHYLGKAKHYWNPAWGANDFFLNTPDAHLVFYWSIGWLTLFFSLATVAWIGRLVAWGLLAWAWRRAGYALVPRPLFGVLSAALFVLMVARYNLAGEWIVGGVEAKVFAYVLVLLAVEALLKNRWNRVWLLLGGAAAFHVLVGGWSVVAAGFAWLSSDRANRPTLRSMVPALVGGFALSLPGLLPALWLTQGVDPEIVNQANQIYVYERLPHHLAPHTLRAGELMARLLRTLGMLAALAALAAAVPNGERVRRLRAFVVGSILLALIGFAIALATGDNHELGAKLLRYYWFRLFDFAVPLSVAMFAALLLSAWQLTRPKWTAAALAALLGLCAWHFTDVMQARREYRFPPADRKMSDADDWRAACEWIAARTPEEAVFLTPRMASTFHWYANRSAVVAHKNIPQDAAGIVEWWDRLDQIHRYDYGGERRHWQSLADEGAARLQELAKQYHAQYVVTENTPPLALPLLYQNDTYAVYRLDDGQE